MRTLNAACHVIVKLPMTSRALLSSHLLAHALLVLPTAVAAAESDLSFSNPTLLSDRIGLFIGIDKYPKMDGGDLEGCVNDARRLRDLFTERYRFRNTLLLCDENATRNGIADAFKQLAEQVRLAKTQHDGTIHVVITYAGHGSRVKDDEEEEPDGLDETWVAHDSTIDDGLNDIRDDELRAVYKSLVDLGCQVVLISDSCHSGTLFRGSARTRSISRAIPVSGPRDNAFATFTNNRARGSTSQSDVLPGFIFYGACNETELAYEAKDESGKPCGRFTYALRSVLPKMNRDSTYSEIHTAVLDAFNTTWPLGPRQIPQFTASNASQDAFFLAGGRAVPHATVVPGTIQGGKLTLTMGEIDGVATGASFEFFATTADLIDRRSPVAKGIVENVLPLICTVKLESDESVDETVKAVLDMVRMQDFVVKADASLPGRMKDALKEMHSAGRVRVVSANDENYDVAVHSMASETNSVGIFLPTAEPLTEVTPRPLRTIPLNTLDVSVGLLQDELLYLARIQRLGSLTYNSDRIALQINSYTRGPSGELTSVERPKIDGVQRLIHGDRFTLTVQNDLSADVFVTVFYMSDWGELTVLYPTETEPRGAQVPPGGNVEIGSNQAFVAFADDQRQIEAHGFERAKAKVIVSSEPIALRRLAFKPQRSQGTVAALKSRGAAGTNSSLFDLIGSAVHGDPVARGLTTESLPKSWATSTVVVDIEPAR